MNYFPVINITNPTLNITWNTYSLQDALSPNSMDAVQGVNGYMAPYLFHTGCLVDSVHNCTVACQDPGSAFSSLDTLHNCMMYPIIADQYSKSNLSMETAQLADSLGIGKEQWPSSSISLNITKTIGNCLDAYCKMLEYCNDAAQNENQSLYDVPNYSTFLNQTGRFYFDLDLYHDNFDFSFDLCDFFDVTIDQDIGGLGVYISYWIQTGIVLLAFLMVFWWKWAVCYLSLRVFHSSPNPNREARSPRTRSRGRTARLAALSSALVDFHKAQCFFVLAINLAAQVIIKKGGLEPKSLQEVYNTWVLIKTVSIGGYLPVTFTLFTLHLVDLVSWYLLSLTICAASISIATFIKIGNFNPSDDDIRSVNLTASSQGPAACGQHTPGAWCYTPYDFSYDFGSDPSSGAYSMLGFCAFVLFLLMAKQFGADKYLSDVYRRKLRESFPKDKYIERWIFTWRKGFIAAWKVLRSWQPRWTQSEWFTKVTDTTSKGFRFRGLFPKEAIIKTLKSFGSIDWPKASQTAFIVLFYATITGLYGYFFFLYCVDLFVFASSVSSEWTFGQIVAITVWVGPLCEYIHLEIRGMKRGFQHRLLAPYKVIKGDAEENESVSDEEGAAKAGEGEELASLPTANLLPAQPYPSSATNSAYEQVRDPDSLTRNRTTEQVERSENSRYHRVELREEYMPLEVNLPEEDDITWQMSDFTGPEREALSYI